jgi:hypothetical protein
MKYLTFQTRGLIIQTSRDWNGRFFICYSSSTSLFLNSSKAVLRWAKYPKSTPTREALEKWLTELDAADAARLAAKAAAQASGILTEEPAGPIDEAAGFGPEVFTADEDDPTANTKMIV